MQLAGKGMQKKTNFLQDIEAAAIQEELYLLRHLLVFQNKGNLTQYYLKPISWLMSQEELPLKITLAQVCRSSLLALRGRRFKHKI